MDAIPGSVENNSGTIAGVFETAGESFADGSAIELVSSSTGNRPGLFFWRDGRDPTVASHVQREGRFYVPINAGSTIWAATTLPTGIVDRGPSANLFAETRQLVETYIGASSAEAALATAWNATTWFADILPNPPALFVHGPDMSFAIKLFWLFSCIGRHPLIVTEIGRAALCSLMVFATHITHQSGANVPSVSRTVLRVELQRPGSSRIQRRSSRSCELKSDVCRNRGENIERTWSSSLSATCTRRPSTIGRSHSISNQGALSAMVPMAQTEPSAKGPAIPIRRWWSCISDR